LIDELTTQSPQASKHAWIFPVFWDSVFCIGLALSVLALYARQPAHLEGWPGIWLAALLLGNFGAYNLIAWGWLYADRRPAAWRGPLYFMLQILLLSALIWWYGSEFAWICLALLYPVIGGLPTRQWPLPLACLLLVFVGGTLLWSDATAGSLLYISLQIVLNAGIAVVLRLMSGQSARLRAALAQLRRAHIELAASAEQKEELAVLRERARLAREMHDNLGHALVVMNVKLEAAQLLYARDPSRGDAELEATRALIRSTMTELRRALADLRAPAAHGDLPGALGRLARELQGRTRMAVTCRIAPELPAPPSEACGALWYVAREALANVEQHAAATSVDLALEYVCDSWLLRVSDDGAGVRPADLRRAEHYGVLGMRERMNNLGGMLDLRTGPAGGTIVEARLPKHAALELSAR
jgi:signal transduction histidine kinase